MTFGYRDKFARPVEEVPEDLEDHRPAQHTAPAPEDHLEDPTDSTGEEGPA